VDGKESTAEVETPDTMVFSRAAGLTVRYVGVKDCGGKERVDTGWASETDEVCVVEA
jgi:hypothetical protein